MKKISLFLFLFLLFFYTQGQKRSVDYKTSLTGFVASQNTLPFWAINNKHGLIPNGHGALLEVGLFSDFTNRHKIQFAYGVSVAGFLSRPDNHLILDQLYARARWRNLRLDLGMIHPAEEYQGISSTNGNFIRSGNARTFPGYNLNSEYMKVPCTKGILSIKFNWADYMMIDDRYVKDTRLHNKSVFLKIKPHQRWEIIVGLEHWAQWAGTSPDKGKQPSSFHDYLRIICAKEGGIGASVSDSINALGNHLGREHLAINYLADNYTLSFYHDIPFEDGSGTDFRSFPDGTYCFYYGSKKKDQWITDIIYEFYYTKYQSGSRHDRPATPKEMEKQDPKSHFYGRKVLGGCDNYFNNGEYRSGWTLYERVIGSPFMTPGLSGNITRIINNRVVAHHVGMKGRAWQTTPYKLMLSYSRNYGTYGNPMKKNQLSGALEITLPFKNLPFAVETGIYGDLGDLFKDNFGFTIKLSRKGKLLK